MIKDKKARDKKEGITPSNRYQKESFVISAWWKLKESAKKRGYPFDITITKLKKELYRKKCPYLGCMLLSRFNFKTPNGVEQPFNLLTIDRIDSDEGYTDENIIACSYRANQIKSDCTLEEVLSLAKGMKKLQEAKK